MINEQINCKKLDIKLSTELVFEQFAHLPHAVLLDSSNAQHENSRYDIISFEPKHLVEAKNKHVFLDGKQQTQSCFAIMQSLLSDLSNTQTAENLPFTGGWLGYFGYDLGRYIESMPELTIEDITMPDMSVGLYLDALIFDNQASEWFYVSQPNFDRLDTYLAAINKQAAKAVPFKLTSEWQSNLDKSAYEKQFDRIQAYLKSGDCYQINLAQRFKAEFSGSTWQAYKQLREANKAPFSSYINHPDGA
ncbi:MAG: chorismate-binding protein, partial [Pseudoalteromonas shioyasakiensis]